MEKQTLSQYLFSFGDKNALRAITTQNISKYQSVIRIIDNTLLIALILCILRMGVVFILALLNGIESLKDIYMLSIVIIVFSVLYVIHRNLFVIPLAVATTEFISKLEWSNYASVKAILSPLTEEQGFLLERQFIAAENIAGPNIVEVKRKKVSPNIE